MRLIDADELLKHETEADCMGAMLVVGKGHILSAPTVIVRKYSQLNDREHALCGCGGQATPYEGEFKRYLVECINCGIKTLFRPTIKLAWAAWDKAMGIH